MKGSHSSYLLQTLLIHMKFSYKKNNYLAFIADLKIHKIRMHINYRNTKDKNAQKFIKLINVKKYLEDKEPEDILFVTS